MEKEHNLDETTEQMVNFTNKKNYHYKLSSTNLSSNTYGVCEICGKHVSEVFVQTETRYFFNIITKNISLTHAGCHPTRFGHKECLLSIRR